MTDETRKALAMATGANEDAGRITLTLIGGGKYVVPKEDKAQAYETFQEWEDN